jgi:hypothetical protein
MGMLVVEQLMSLAGAPSELGIGRALGGAWMLARWESVARWCSTEFCLKAVMLGCRLEGPSRLRMGCRDGDADGRAADVARWRPQRVEHWASIGRCLDACSVGICGLVVLHQVLLESLYCLDAGWRAPAGYG